jgi:MFS transporter, ACS family, glucarate transporter
MNTSGQSGSVLSPLMVMHHFGQLRDWNVPLVVVGGLFLLGAVCWYFINPHLRVFD